VVETLLIDRIVSQPDRFEFANKKLLERYAGKLGAAVGVSLHMGNWELASWPLTAIGASPTALYRTIRNPYVDAYLRKLRSGLYPDGLVGRGADHDGDDRDIARLITQVVRSGKRIGIVCDQYYRRGVPVNFFGRSTLAQPVAAIVARRVGARIWVARCLRVGNASRFRIDVREVKVPRTNDAAADVKAILAALHSQFEEWIREAPEQWLWSVKRWE
jgi:KDO2-lipid IV(A) lauroyltransferase